MDKPRPGSVHRCGDKNGGDHLGDVAGEVEGCAHDRGPQAARCDCGPPDAGGEDHNDASQGGDSERTGRVPSTKPPASHPIRYPADGPANTAIPPRPPESSGNPIATSTSHRSTAAHPLRAPMIAPVSMTPRVCSVIGTAGPRYIPGARPSAAMRAANTAICARSRDVTRVPPRARTEGLSGGELTTPR